MKKTLPFEDLESVYDLLALAVDEAGPDRESLFLAKLCLLMAHEIGDIAVVRESIAAALADIEI